MKSDEGMAVGQESAAGAAQSKTLRKCEYLIREDGVTGGVWQRECGQPAERRAAGGLKLCESHAAIVERVRDKHGYQKFKLKPIDQTTNEPINQRVPDDGRS